MRIHPGETLKEMMEDREYSIYEIAHRIQNYRLNSFNHNRWFPNAQIDTTEILNEVKMVLSGGDIDLITAIGFGAAFGTGHEFWLNLQTNYDEEGSDGHS